MKELLTALRLFVVLSLLTGVIYPLIVTGVAQAAFPHQANGSLIQKDEKFIGSELIGQQFDDPKYFWGRLSATSPFAYNPASSSGSNFGPTNPSLIGGLDKDGKPIAGSVADRVSALRAADPGNRLLVPTDLATASGSGLDPNISVASAEFQIPRIVLIRHLDEGKVRMLVDKATTQRQLGFLGEPVVNVLKLNISLDKEAR